jgi:hypothetical protein
MYQSCLPTSIQFLRVSGVNRTSLHSRIADVCKLAHRDGAPIPSIVKSARLKSIVHGLSYRKDSGNSAILR